MKIFLDSANLEEINKYNNYKIIDGITTNPSLMASSKLSIAEFLKEVTRIVEGDISVELISNDYEEMVKEGKKLLEIAYNLVIKLPLTWHGIKACRHFSNLGVKVNMTLCFSVNQAILAAKSGATYVSPFVGRLDDIGGNGIKLLSDIKTVYVNYNMNTKILAASIRSAEHIEQAAICGVNVITLPAKILENIINHDLTISGLKKFNDDWQRSGKSLIN